MRSTSSLSIVLLTLALAGCGASAPAEGTTPAQPSTAPGEEAREDGEGEGEPVLIGALGGGVLRVTAATPPPPEPPAPVLPAGHVVAPGAPADGELAEGEAAYARVLAAPLGSSEAAEDVREAGRELRAQLQAAYSALRSLDEAYEAGASANAALRPRSLVRRGDARDALADRLLATSFPMPVDLRRRIQRASPEVQDEVQRAFDERVQLMMAEHAHELWCQAARLYEQAAEGGAGEAETRAREQRDRYGDAFLESCAAR